MQIFSDAAELQVHLSTARDQKQSIALIPTMGNLHPGHLALVKEAQAIADVVVVSIFVNPLQFAPHEDFDRYPRTLATDTAQLTALGIDYLFTPSIDIMCPAGQPQPAIVDVPGLSHILCGQTRPHFFQGVATIVTKLFHLVQPHHAIFGEKDFQQAMVIQTMVDALNFPVEIRTIPIVREQDGLALSSRNQYLSPKARKLAPQFYSTLSQAAQKLAKQGRGAWQQTTDIESEITHQLKTLGFQVDYIALRRQDNLQPPTQADQPLILLGAVYLDKTRLIDNIKIAPAASFSKKFIASLAMTPKAKDTSTL